MFFNISERYQNRGILSLDDQTGFTESKVFGIESENLLLLTLFWNEWIAFDSGVDVANMTVSEFVFFVISIKEGIYGKIDVLDWYVDDKKKKNEKR